MTEHRSESLQTRLVSWLSQPVDIAWLVAFRVVFGLTMAVSMLRFIAYGWIDDFFVTPKFHFKYWLFDWVEPLTAPLMHGLFWLLFVLSLCVALGFWFRLSAGLFLLGFAYLQLLDVAIYLNHYYLVLVLGVLLAISPAARAYSLDAFRRGAARTQGGAHVARLWLVLLRFQVGIVYTFAGLAKATSDWLLYAQPLNIWLSARTDLPLLGPLFTQPWAPMLMSWAGFLFDTTIVWWLLWPRARPYAYAVVIVFHALTRLLFPIGMFPVIMTLSALVFFPPDWPRRALALWRSRRARASEPNAHEVLLAGTRAPADGQVRRVSGWALLALMSYALLQVVLPLRTWAYGGDVLWHEQGMRFSWRVMVREKNGSVTFHVRLKGSDRVWQVTGNRWLTRQQESEMASQPDLILQFAHFLRDDFQARGLGPVEVRAEALVSLNGRPAAVMVDPAVDLAAIDDGLAKARWILPAPRVIPPRVRPI